LGRMFARSYIKYLGREPVPTVPIRFMHKVLISLFPSYHTWTHECQQGCVLNEHILLISQFEEHFSTTHLLFIVPGTVSHFLCTASDCSLFVRLDRKYIFSFPKSLNRRNVGNSVARPSLGSDKSSNKQE
jgi:hypothetical protein